MAPNTKLPTHSTYIQLSEAEAAFRIHKSDLSIRPIWHQRTERVQAHILVCFLAYLLWKTLEQWQSHPDWVTARAPFSLKSAASRASTWSYRWPRIPNAMCAFAALPDRSGLRHSCSTALASASLSVCGRRAQSQKCSANFGPQTREKPSFHPPNCGSWASSATRCWNRSRFRVGSSCRCRSPTTSNGQQFHRTADCAVQGIEFRRRFNVFLRVADSKRPPTPCPPC